MTYAENAALKDRALVQATDLACDSGLEVNALNGKPGALHHLKGWDGADQEERIEMLLKVLKDVKP